MEVAEASPETLSQVTNPDLSTLEEEKELLHKSLSRCELAPVIFGNYAKQLEPHHGAIDHMSRVMEDYFQQGEKWDKRIQELKRKIGDVENRIKEAQNSVTDTTTQAEGPLLSSHQVQFILEADGAVEVAVRLVYCRPPIFFLTSFLGPPEAPI